MSLLSMFAPAIVKVIFYIFDFFGAKKARKKQFLETIANKVSENVAIRLRQDYQDLSFDKRQDDDVF